MDFIKFFFRFFLFLFHSITHISTPISRIPTLIPRIPTLIPRSVKFSTCLFQKKRWKSLFINVEFISNTPQSDSCFVNQKYQYIYEHKP